MCYHFGGALSTKFSFVFFVCKLQSSNLLLKCPSDVSTWYYRIALAKPRGSPTMVCHSVWGHTINFGVEALLSMMCT